MVRLYRNSVFRHFILIDGNDECLPTVSRMYIRADSPTRITDKFFIAIGTGYLFNIIPLPVVYMVILIIVFSFLLSKTKFGTYVYAIGRKP